MGATRRLRLLADAGLTIDKRYGDWDASPLTGTSPEIITVARRRGPPG